jgi:hypothetical protein
MPECRRLTRRNAAEARWANRASRFLIDSMRGCVFGFFVKNMRARDRSLARYPGFEEYRASTGLLFPKLIR